MPTARPDRRLSLLLPLFLAACAVPADRVTASMEQDFRAACAAPERAPGSSAFRACVLDRQQAESPRERAQRIRDQM